MQTYLAWEALEYEHTPRSSDWFWGLGIVAVGGLVLAIIFGNLLFGLVIVVGAVALGVHAVRKPHLVECSLTDKGIVINETIFPYKTLESFSIQDHVVPNQLILTSQKVFMPHITILLSDVATEDVRDVLDNFLPEEEVEVSFSDRILEFFGF